MTTRSADLLRPYAWRMVGLLTLVAAAALAEIAGLVMLSAVLAVVIQDATTPAAGGITDGVRRWAMFQPVAALATLALVYVAKTLLALWVTYSSFALGVRMAEDWSRRLMRAYLTTPLQRLTRHHGSMVNSLLGEPAQVGSGLATGGLLAQSALSAASVYVVLLVLAPLITLGLTIVAAVALLGVLVLSSYARSISLRRLAAADDAHASTAETISALKQIRLFNLESDAAERVDNALKQLRRLQRTSNVVSSAPRLLIEIVFLLGVTAMLASAISGAANTGLADVGLVIAAAFRLLPSFSGAAGTWIQLQQAWPGLARIAAELDTLEAPSPEERHGRKLAVFRDRIIVENVHFSHADREKALDAVDLEIPRGSFIGIVGPSGSGKSTLVDLLCGFYSPQHGRILVDGVDLGNIDRSSWRAKLGVVAQDSFLFSGTVRDNLILLAPNADAAAVARVASITGADDVVARLPDGYDTRLAERGVRLSGGQRQRLALARVLLKAPDVLILDEATSALDVESDERLQRDLLRARGAATLIVVAHRLTSVKDADRIYVIVSGRCVESGTHEELLRREGRYAAMWRVLTSEAPAAQSSVNGDAGSGS